VAGRPNKLPSQDKIAWLRNPPGVPRVALANLPTPIQHLPRLTRRLGGPDIWMKRDDLTGLPGGGNKTRKLEFVVADALAQGADTLVTVGGIQSNHTRQTAAAAAKVGLGCALLHCRWVPNEGPHYRHVGNVLLSSLLGAELFLDDVPREIGDETSLPALVAMLRDRGRRPYVIPGGASEHRLGGLGYAACAAEIAQQASDVTTTFDAIVHCTGSGSTQAGLLAGFATLGLEIDVIGVADDGERDEKLGRVLRLARSTLAELGESAKIEPGRVAVRLADEAPYGVTTPRIVDAIRLLAETEGIIADPVYEGRAVRGLMDLIEQSAFSRGQRVLLMHLGGMPAVGAYAGLAWTVRFEPAPAVTVS
jgi:1-aminocyclopropane-1-carboxylate deaminase